MDSWVAKAHEEDPCDPNGCLGLCSVFLSATSQRVQCQTDAIRFCTCELCGALETPRNSPDLSLGEQFFTVIVQVIALVVGKKKKKQSQGIIMWRGNIPRAMATGLHVENGNWLYWAHCEQGCKQPPPLHVDRVAASDGEWCLQSSAWNCFSWSSFNSSQERLMGGALTTVLTLWETVLFLLEPIVVVKLRGLGWKRFWESTSWCSVA